MAQDLSYEDTSGVWFITSRTNASRLWFVNNPVLERYILAFLAKYQNLYRVRIYGFILMGNHYHLVAGFPLGNKAAFLRSFNSMIARLVNSFVDSYDGGRLWGRRARAQKLAEDPDIEHWTLYAALNPVSSGLTQKYTESSCYNSFSNAISGRSQAFELVDWADFHNRKRRNKQLKKEQCTKIYTLTYSRLPGYEQHTRKDYRETLLKKAEQRRCKIVEDRIQGGKGFAGKEALQRTRPGAKPNTTKKAERRSTRPLILTLSNEARRICLDIYFGLLKAYKDASRRYRSGELEVGFPPGTYRPILLCPP